MNRVDFMSQLERLLQNIAPAEREEALQYYNDYFDDAGKENEQEVIEALGNPARVAENIKRDLLGSGYGDGPSQSAKASDRALVEYGQSTGSGSQEPGDETADSRENGDRKRDHGGLNDRTEKRYYDSLNDRNVKQDYSSRNAWDEKWDCGGTDGWNENRDYGGANGWDGKREYGGENHSRATAPEKSVEHNRMPAWAIALLTTGLLLFSPFLAGALLSVAAVLFGVLVVWHALIFSFGVAALCLFLVLAVLVITGILCLFANPWVGMAMIGGGLVCGAVGILFLMLTVGMAGIATPAICKGIAGLFRGGRKRLRERRGRLA